MSRRLRPHPGGHRLQFANQIRERNLPVTAQQICPGNVHVHGFGLCHGRIQFNRDIHRFSGRTDRIRVQLFYGSTNGGRSGEGKKSGLITVIFVKRPLMHIPACNGSLRGFPRAILCILSAASLLVHATGLLAGEAIHAVKPGETLYRVARIHGISIAALAERNGLKSNARLLVGAKLAIPKPRSNVRASQAELPSTVQTAISATRVRLGRWRHIVLHHSGTSEGSAKGMNEYHLKVRHMENGLAYHFVIGNGRGMGDGEIYVGDRWKKQLNGGHLASELQNQSSLGICLVGNFDQKAPSARQLKGLTALIKALQKRCNLSDKAVLTHQQINIVHTRCPGIKFSIKSVLARLRH